MLLHLQPPHTQASAGGSYLRGLSWWSFWKNTQVASLHSDVFPSRDVSLSAVTLFYGSVCLLSTCLCCHIPQPNPPLKYKGKGKRMYKIYLIFKINIYNIQNVYKIYITYKICIKCISCIKYKRKGKLSCLLLITEIWDKWKVKENGKPNKSHSNFVWSDAQNFPKKIHKSFCLCPLKQIGLIFRAVIQTEQCFPPHWISLFFTGKMGIVLLSGQKKVRFQCLGQKKVRFQCLLTAVECANLYIIS